MIKLKYGIQDKYRPKFPKELLQNMYFVDLKISILKPIHAKWVIQYYDRICTNKDIVKNGGHRSGITKAIKGNISKKDAFEN